MALKNAAPYLLRRFIQEYPKEVNDSIKFYNDYFGDETYSFRYNRNKPRFGNIIQGIYEYYRLTVESNNQSDLLKKFNAIIQQEISISGVEGQRQSQLVRLLIESHGEYATYLLSKITENLRTGILSGTRFSNKPKEDANVLSALFFQDQRI